MCTTENFKTSVNIDPRNNKISTRRQNEKPRYFDDGEKNVARFICTTPINIQVSFSSFTKRHHNINVLSINYLY